MPDELIDDTNPCTISREAALLAEVARLRRQVANVGGKTEEPALTVSAGTENRAGNTTDHARSPQHGKKHAAPRTSESHLRLILESATDFAIMATDLEARITEWNLGARNILGWSEAEMLGQDARIIWTPEDREARAPEEEMRQAREEGSAADDRWHLRHDGSRFWASGRLMPLNDDAGTQIGYLKILRDRTERHEAERRLNDSESQLRIQREFLDTLIRQAPIGISIADAKSGSAVVLNDKARELLGHADLEENFGSYQGYGAVHADGRPYASEDYPTVRALRRGVVIEREEMTYRLGGTAAGDGARTRRLEVSSTPVRDASGEVAAVVTVFSDVEKERQAADLLRDMNEVLAQRVAAEMAERTRAEAQLRQSQKMEAVGQLTGGIAHDFNNLLTGITGSLELLTVRLTQGRFTDVERYVAAAQGAAKRAAALTHRLLAFSRQQTLDPKPTDVNELVGGMEDLIRRTAGPAVNLEIAGAKGLWPTLVDPSQLENALLNLCINARDAMPGGGRMTIETANCWLDERGARERDLQSGHYVSLCVSDSGTGMSPEVIARAFDPFFTTKPLGLGTGLGLSMVYGFVRQSGGQTRIYSETSQGTNVCLYLPRFVGDTETVEAMPELADAPRAGLGETVLVVDDEPTVRMLVAEVLEELGYAAIEAADGASGLRVLQSNVRIDLLVSDVGLPGGMNGRQMADAARVQRPDLKVLFITGYAETAVVGNGHLDPGMRVMTKPFAMEALASRIKEMIAGR
ncbi:MAG: PAS domain S-box protein [Janthinobacterium lividum]